MSCWRQDRRCIVCRDSFARGERRYMHMCKGCTKSFFPEKPAAVVGQEGGFFTDVLSEVAS